MIKKLPFILFLFLSFFFFSASFCFAQNKAGINIGTKYSDIDRAISTVGSGGWVVVIAGGTGDCNMLQGVIDKTNAANVNLLIRGHLNNYLRPYDAKGWAATLGSLNTDKKIYFMPWNEPNQSGSGDWGDPADVAAYTDALLQQTQEAGIRGKVAITSPAINITHPNREEYIDQLGGGAYFSKFDAIAINLYDSGERVCGQPMCNPDPFNNPGKADQVLARMGASGKQTIIHESGTAGGNIWYFQHPPDSNSPLYRFVQAYLNSGKYPFAIPSYDLAGEVGHSWSLFSRPDVANLLAGAPDGGTTAANFDPDAFAAWLNPLVESGQLVSCGEGNCGYAPAENPGLCTATSGLTPFVPLSCLPVPGQDPGIKCGGPPITLQEKVYYTYDEGECITRNFSGDIRLSNLDIPFARNLADYFTGIIDHDHLSVNAATNAWQECIDSEYFHSCWRKVGRVKPLTPKEEIDKLKIAFLEEIADRIENHQNTRYEDFVIQGMRPRQLIERFKATQDLPFSQEEKEADEKFLKEIWLVMPLFANEESQGVISFAGDGASGWVDTSIPDVYRLNKTTEFLNTMLVPEEYEAEENQGGYKPKQPLMASSNYSQPYNMSGIWIFDFFKNIFSKVRKVFAQDCPNCLTLGITNVRYEGGMIKYEIQACHTCTGYGAIGDVSFGPCGHLNHYQSIWPPCSIVNWWAAVPPISASCPGTYTICVSAKPDRNVHDSCKGITISHSCQVTLDDSCQITETNCGGTGPPADTCPETSDTGKNLCEEEATAGPPQTPCCTDLETQQYPNFFGTRQFKNDCEEADSLPCSNCSITGPSSCSYECPAGYNPTNKSCIPMENKCSCDCVRGPQQCDKSFEVDVNITNVVPFLASIAKLTIDPLGIYQIFIPSLTKEEDSDIADQEVEEKLAEMANPVPGADNSVAYNLAINQKSDKFDLSYPGSGSFRVLYDKLCTVFHIKNWLSEKVLLPEELMGEVQTCRSTEFVPPESSPQPSGLPSPQPSRRPDITNIAWQRYNQTGPLFPLDSNCYTYRDQTLTFVPPPPEGKWLAIRSFTFSSQSLPGNIQIDIDIFNPRGGQGYVEPNNLAPNFLTLAYKGNPFSIDYGRGLVVYDGYADVRVVIGGAWCQSYDLANPKTATIEVEYAHLDPSEASELYEWWYGDKFMTSGQSLRLPGLFSRVKTGVVSLDGLYSYSTIPTNIGFILQGNEFLRDDNFTASQGDDRIRYYDPDINGHSSEGGFVVKNYGQDFLGDYERIFIHAWGER